MRNVVATMLLLTVCCAPPTRAQVQWNTTWTYQGSLSLSGTPLNASADLRFSLWDAATAGAPRGATINATDISVVDGRFTIDLDFGEIDFASEGLWLEIGVRSPHDPTDTAPFTTLNPRQPLRTAPLAQALPGFRTVRDPNNASWNIIGGAAGNNVQGGAKYATISGGGDTASPNVVSGDYGVVAGGTINSAEFLGTVSGGQLNTAADGAVVGGGQINVASGILSTVGGGQFNSAGGHYGTVPGGSDNRAGGWHSLAAGFSSTVRDSATVGNAHGDEGTFVWSDSTGPFASSGSDQFLIKATGGVGIGTNAPQNQLTVDGDADFSGNVGIGTSNPGAMLQVGDGDGARIYVGSNPSLDFSKDTAAQKFRIQNVGTGYADYLLQIGRDNGAHDISMTGNVGIGIESPAWPLEVDGAIVATNPSNAPDGSYIRLASPGTDVGISFGQGDGAGGELQQFSIAIESDSALEIRDGTTDRIVIDLAGNVGIGTSAPADLLDVAGVVRVDGVRFPDSSLQTSASPAVLSASASVDPSAMTPGAGTTVSMNVPGAAPGDVAIVNTDGLIAPTVISSVGVGTGTVTIRLVNASSTVTHDPPAMVWRVRVIK